MMTIQATQIKIKGQENYLSSKNNLFSDKQEKKQFLVESMIVIIIISLGVTVSKAYGQIIEPGPEDYPQLAPAPYIDPNDPYNLTKLCDQYINLPAGQSPEGIMQCAPYYNETVKERLGLTGDIKPQREPLVPQE
jgi:hypothetical protein